MTLYEDLIYKKDSLAIIGLGYVGIVLAIEFAKKLNVIGFDINTDKINKYKNFIDSTNEVGSSMLKATSVNFTFDENLLNNSKFYIVAVPTPINVDCTPDLTPLITASEIVGKHISKDSIVVYESTVYPGVTEEVCVPIIERLSGLKCGSDFKVGYSPERINPGDIIHRLENTVKIVSGMDNYTLDIIAKVYELIIEAGVYKAPSIKVAEAAKVIENSQRDINIAFVNELSCIFDKMKLDTLEVLKAAATKWNFLNFYPGLVGGHCIGIDPYYLTYKASILGYNSQVILAGRRINDSMGKYVAEKTVKLLIKANKNVNNSKVAILGVTFKENCPDIRNSKVIDIIDELNEYGVEVFCTDPIACPVEFSKEYGLYLTSLDSLMDMDAVIIAVSHKEYKSLNINSLLKLFPTEDTPIIVDVKGIFNKDELLKNNCLYWRL